MIRKFLRNFRSPFPSSQEAFEILTAPLDPDRMNVKQAMRIIDFGKYLREHELASPLGWNAIDEALATVPAQPRMQDAAQNIRSCLLNVGHLLASAGRIETRKDHALNRRLSMCIANAPHELREILQSFAKWSIRRKTTCRYVLRQIETVCTFWVWCLANNVTSLDAVNPYCVNQYFLISFYLLVCSKCGTTTPVDCEASRGTKRYCSCGSRKPLVMAPKLDPETIVGVRSKLVVFFDWACINRLSSVNPIRFQRAHPWKRIQHCSFDALPSLYKFIMDAQSDPVEAFALYLTIAHLFTGWELQQVRIPRSDQSSSVLDLTQLYGLTAPSRPVSIGKRSQGRQLAQFSFLESARPWLIGLLSRFQAQRAQILNGRKNDYVFVAPGRGHNNVPVSTAFIRGLILRATSAALGYQVPQNLLRKTASLVVAAKVGPAILKNLGYGEKQAVAYSERRRELVVPKSTSRLDARELIQSPHTEESRREKGGAQPFVMSGHPLTRVTERSIKNERVA